jgi:hypothetical protein
MFHFLSNFFDDSRMNAHNPSYSQFEDILGGPYLQARYDMPVIPAMQESIGRRITV